MITVGLVTRSPEVMVADIRGPRSIPVSGTKGQGGRAPSAPGQRGCRGRGAMSPRRGGETPTRGIHTREALAPGGAGCAVCAIVEIEGRLRRRGKLHLVPSGIDGTLHTLPDRSRVEQHR